MELPWFIYDLNNLQLITSNTIPEGEIGDTKNVVFTETPIVGNNYAPVSAGAYNNRKITLTIPILNRGYEGNMAVIKQFENLRNMSNGVFGLKSKFWANTPKVLYYWGVGSVPLVYFVTKCDIVHDASFVNSMGVPQYSRVTLELTLDETDKLYKAEEIYRQAMSLLGGASAAVQRLRGSM